jgi:hypothetical protein
MPPFSYISILCRRKSIVRDKNDVFKLYTLGAVVCSGRSSVRFLCFGTGLSVKLS